MVKATMPSILNTVRNIFMILYGSVEEGGGRVVRWCWVNFQCWGVLLIWIIVGQGPIVLAVGAGGGCLDIFSLIYHFSSLSPSPLSPSLWETARYRLEYCLKGPLSPNQPTNQLQKRSCQCVFFKNMATLVFTCFPLRI